MGYLLSNDLRKSIQSENLAQIIGGNTDILTAAELTAIEEAKSYLAQKYDIADEFKDIAVWDNTTSYKAGQRVYLDAQLFDVTKAYLAPLTLVLYQGGVYVTLLYHAPGAWPNDPAKFGYLGPQYALYYAQYPKPIFNYNTQYAAGDQVFWKDKTYTNVNPSYPLGQTAALQYREYENIPLLNVAPDNVNSGLLTWGAGSTYTIANNTPLSNINYWTAGDSRSQQLLTVVVDITLYHVHSRISPRNIPELRVKRYDDAIAWLKMAARGEITAAMPLLQPKAGGRVRYGGPVKNINSY